jgi:hypothetical protein
MRLHAANMLFMFSDLRTKGDCFPVTGLSKVFERLFAKFAKGLPACKAVSQWDLQARRAAILAIVPRYSFRRL